VDNMHLYVMDSVV